MIYKMASERLRLINCNRELAARWPLPDNVRLEVVCLYNSSYVTHETYDEEYGRSFADGSSISEAYYTTVLVVNGGVYANAIVQTFLLNPRRTLPVLLEFAAAYPSRARWEWIQEVSGWRETRYRENLWGTDFYTVSGDYWNFVAKRPECNYSPAFPQKDLRAGHETGTALSLYAKMKRVEERILSRAREDGISEFSFAELCEIYDQPGLLSKIRAELDRAYKTHARE